MAKARLVTLFIGFMSWGGTSAQGTKHFNRWPLTNGVELNFNATPAMVAETVPSIYLAQPVFGCDGITGELAFIAEDVIWDSERQEIPGATWEGMQIVAALPHPGDDSIWYLFNMDGYDTLAYSVFDRRLRDGLGDLTDLRDVPILTLQGAAKLTAISADNGSTHRLLVHVNSTAELIAFNVDSESGLDTVAVHMPLGVTIDWQDILSSSGDIAVSSDNRMVCITGSYGTVPDNRIYLIPVAPNDGSAGTVMEIALNGFEVVGSRMAFSPSGQYLYVPIGVCEVPGCGSIKRYDVSLPSAELVAASETTFTQSYTGPQSGHFNLALGPDGIIYGRSSYPPYYLQHVVRFLEPDCPGGECGWDPVGLETPVEAILSFELPWTFWPQQNTTGIQAADRSSSVLAIAPNPAVSVARINWNTNGERADEMQLHDAQGRLVAQYALRASSGSCSVDVSGLEPGLYSVTILLRGTASVHGKLIVER